MSKTCLPSSMLAIGFVKNRTDLAKCSFFEITYVFGIWNFGHCELLFGICYLGFYSSDNRSRQLFTPTRYVKCVPSSSHLQRYRIRFL